MVFCDWANGGSVGVFFRHGMVSGPWWELVLPGNEYGIQGQNCVARLQGRVLYGPITENLIKI